MGCLLKRLQLILLESVLLSEFVTSKTTEEIIYMGGGKARRKGEAQKAGRNERVRFSQSSSYAGYYGGWVSYRVLSSMALPNISLLRVLEEGHPMEVYRNASTSTGGHI